MLDPSYITYNRCLRSVVDPVIQARAGEKGGRWGSQFLTDLLKAAVF